MPFPYLPATQAERELMLKEIGVRTFEDLVSHIPAEVKAKPLELRAGLAELELTRELSQLAAKNKPASQQASFLGGGSYRRFVPAVVPAVISRSEFSTAYTPYQPEVSQGSLQAIYEFQTAICLITGMDVANASMYDAPTALAEACLMAVRLTGKKKIVLSEALNPEHRMVTETYARSCDLPCAFVTAAQKGATDSGAALEKEIADDCACFVVQYPNYFGTIEAVQEIADKVHAKGALLVVVTDPISLGLLKAPGDLGADIVVGDAQSCGNSLAFGGPSAGYMACRKEFIRQLPGRLAGMTVDNRGQTAFTLTLQTREQHIRRAKATSNICTNQALNALAMLVYLTAMGPQGLRDLANISLQRAHYLADALTKIDGVELTFKEPFFNEFAITLPADPSAVLQALTEHKVLGGLKLGTHFKHLQNSILVAVTEMNPKEDLDLFAQSLAEVLKALPAKARDDAKQSSSQPTSQKKVLTV
ncbi:MAG: aminomethyl-transferring glycine dehydrogenase subunit GcvPA [Cyanobacteria bacterium REEB67]|nr:aminomethyl-transferring glycine dehydrogenase subunit GcvPA [Cyanobacteria bacterium REEB67]